MDVLGYIMSNLYILLLTMERVISRGPTFPSSLQKLSIEKRPQETIAAVQIMACFFLGPHGGSMILFKHAFLQKRCERLWVMKDSCLSRWWFQNVSNICLGIFIRKMGEDESNLTHIFLQVGGSTPSVVTLRHTSTTELSLLKASHIVQKTMNIHELRAFSPEGKSIQPWKLTWNPNITQLKRKIIWTKPPFLGSSH